MSINRKDLSLLYDIYISCVNVLDFIKGMKFYQFSEDRKTKSAVERELEIIGQVAKLITTETQDSLNNIPWSNIIGLRNILAHDYGSVLVEKVWLISRTSVKELLKELRKIKDLKKYIKKV